MKHVLPKTFFPWIMLICLMLACFSQNTAMAQQNQTTALDKTKKKTANYGLPTIIVTAEKRETDVQKTPSAITVISGQKLEDANISTVQEVVSQIPNLQMGNMMGSSSFMNFRGIPTATGTNTNPLVMYIDGVPMDTFTNFDANLMDIERIEVLRGPQSVIYGKNTLGGIINIVSKKPDNILRARADGTWESYGSYFLGASAGGPIKEDKLFFSLSAGHNQKNGFLDAKNADNKYSHTTERIKGQLRSIPSEQTELALHTDYTMSRKKRMAYSIGEAISTESLAGDRDFLDCDLFNISGTGKFTFDALTFETTTTGRFEHETYSFDMNNMLPGYNYADAGRDTWRNEVTQEFRFRSLDGHTGLKWIAGMYASYADLDIKKIESHFLPMHTPTGIIQFYQNQPYHEYSKEFSPFAQMDIPLGERVILITGLRWHYAQKKASISYEPNLDMQKILGRTPMHTEAEDSWTQFLPRLTLAYQPNGQQMFYAGVSRSFIPGGYNYGTTSNQEFTYDSQTAWNFEVGAKNTFLDNRLQVNPVLFYTRLKDLQIMTYDNAAGIFTAGNAGQATSYGAELDLIFQILPGLNASISTGYTHACYDQYAKKTVAGVEIYDDKYIYLTPKFSGIASLQYRHESGFFARIEAQYTSKLYWNDANTMHRNPVTIVNTKLGYEMEHLDLYVYVKNLFDEQYQEFLTPPLFVGHRAAPRIIGINLAYRF